MLAPRYRTVLHKVMSALMLGPTRVPGLDGWRNAER